MKHCTILVFLLAPIFVFAQSNYYKGSVTGNDGKIITGYINYREWEQNPLSIEFKNNPDDKTPRVFYPSAIKSFTIDGLERYMSYQGKISMNKNQFPNIEDGRDTSSKQETVFLKLITSGSKLSLFLFTDSKKNRIFIKAKDALPQELLYQEYYGESHMQTIAVSTYLAQLNYIIHNLGDNDPEITTKLEHAAYKLNDIEAIVNEINGNQNQNETQNQKKKGESYVRFFVGAGLNATQTSFYGNSYLTGASKASTYTPKISAGSDIFINPNVQRFIFRAELVFGYNKQPDISNGAEAYTFNQYTASIIPQFIYNIYNKNNLKFYIDAGISFNGSIYKNNYLTIYPNKKISNPYDMEPIWISAPFQTGFVINKRIEIFLTYTGIGNFVDISNFTISSKTISTGIHFLFDKSKK